MDPILLTKYGEKLLEYPNVHSIEQSPLGWCAGVHDVCGSFVDLKPISGTHNAFCCRGCYLRIVLPRDIKTFGQAREYLLGEIEKEKLRDAADQASAEPSESEESLG